MRQPPDDPVRYLFLVSTVVSGGMWAAFRGRRLAFGGTRLAFGGTGIAPTRRRLGSFSRNGPRPRLASLPWDKSEMGVGVRLGGRARATPAITSGAVKVSTLGGGSGMHKRGRRFNLSVCSHWMLSCQRSACSGAHLPRASSAAASEDRRQQSSRAVGYDPRE